LTFSLAFCRYKDSPEVTYELAFCGMLLGAIYTCVGEYIPLQGGWRRRLLRSLDCSLCYAVGAAAAILPALAPASPFIKFAVTCTRAFAALGLAICTDTTRRNLAHAGGKVP
jgi:hypothetical protein